MKENKDTGWNPYLAGSLTGLIIIISAWITGIYFGASTSFVRTAGMIEKFLNTERAVTKEYFMQFAPVIDWQWMFVAGIFIG
ncbi:MAG: YeeE/YedE family protein, partial [Candidatus Mariimomonas ferrooxydans]